jgi:hypothetical protein
MHCVYNRLEQRKPLRGIINLTQYGDRSGNFHLSSGREIERESWLG